MAVRRVVANIKADDLGAAQAFYGEVLGMSLVMDHGWIITYSSGDESSAQVSFASEGGSGTPVPDLSIEVDNLDDVLAALRRLGHKIEYGPATEPWGVRRFYVHDPFGRLINIVMHTPS